jgi:hypothetical protein
MNETDLIAPCGMNCGVCSLYLALRHDVKSKGIKMPYCKGCRPRDKKCAFLKKRCSLLLEKTVEFCYECGIFPCENLQRIDKNYRANFRISLIENLEFIRQNGIGAFLAKEKEKWKCPQCGDNICCHNGICYNCNSDEFKSGKYNMYGTKIKKAPD